MLICNAFSAIINGKPGEAFPALICQLFSSGKSAFRIATEGAFGVK